MITIPKNFLHRKTKRMNWNFVFNDVDGALRDWVFEHNLAGKTLNDLIDYVFPHAVVPSFPADIADDGLAMRALNEWFRVNVKGPWTLWSPRQSETGTDEIPNSKFNTYYFQSASDAVFFKMRWG